MFVVGELEKYLDPKYVDELSSVAAKADAIIAGKFSLSCLLDLLLDNCCADFCTKRANLHNTY